MIVSLYQPYFAPFSGFFSKALLSDVFILLDTVQFPLGTTWLNRNRLKNDQGTLWLTVPVWKKGLGLQKINEVRICQEGRWARKHLASLKSAYGKAPFFEDHERFLEEVFSEEYEKLIQMNVRIIRHLMEHLRIPARLLLLSELDIDATEPKLSVMVSKKLGASHFVVQSSAKKYLDEPEFEKEGIELGFFNPRPPTYPQLWGRFIPNLSALDLLLNCGPKSHNVIARASGIRWPESSPPSRHSTP